MTRFRFTLAAALVAFAVGVLAAPAGARPAHATKTQTVTVKMKEFRFIFSTRHVRHGKVVFRLVNIGKLPHDLKIAGKRSKLIKPGKRGTLTVTLKKGHRYAYRCTVPGHAAAGMKGVLRIS